MIFVTGGTGMLGSYLLFELLKTNKHIRASKRTASSFNTTKRIFRALSSDIDILFSKIEWVDVDLFDQNSIENSLNGVTEVYHCAAYISDSSKNKNKLVENNQLITEAVVNAALNKKIEKFCHVSSISALGNSSNNKLITEETLWKEHKNNSTYSTSKYLSEMEVWRGMAEGLNAVIINPSVILGVGDWSKGSANLFDKINKGLKFYTHGSSGFVDAKDVVSIMLRLMDEESSFNQRYIVSAENLDFKFLFEQLASALGVSTPQIYATPLLTQLAWRAEYLISLLLNKEALITKESARTAHKKLKYDNNKILGIIDFKYKKISNTVNSIADFYMEDH